MTDEREPKKTDTLQIRLAPEIKKDFLDACEEDRVSASDVLRRSILDYLTLRKRPSQQHKGQPPMKLFTPRRSAAGILAGLVTAATLVTVAVLPSAADPNLRPTFERLDANHDGKLDAREFTPMPFAGSIFAREARVNGEPGMPRDVLIVEPGVSQSSVQPLAVPSTLPDADGNFRRFDANGDAAVSYDEFTASIVSLLRPVFDVKDLNHDGKLSREEVDAPLTITANLMLSSVRTPGVIQGLLKSDPREVFALLDRNGDGAVTLDEYVPQP